MEQKARSRHWADEKEAVSSYRPYLVMLNVFRHVPITLAWAITHCVAAFFYLFNARARKESKRFQTQLIAYEHSLGIPRKQLHKMRRFRQITAFALTVVERLEVWEKSVGMERITCCDDDIVSLRERLDSGKGAVLFCSHLGNYDLLRGLANYGRTSVKRKIRVVSIMDLSITKNFSHLLNSVNSDYEMDVLDANNIGVESMFVMQECIENGGLVVIAGDRTANHTRKRIFIEQFLGKPAPFAYGSFFLASLLAAPVYFVFTLRDKDYGLHPHYHMHVHCSNIDFDCPRAQKHERIAQLCHRFAVTLEKYTLEKPYQWYNFHDFWAMPDMLQEPDEENEKNALLR